jgi:cytochrome c-type biogenesis protein
MASVLLALVAGMLTVAAPCTLPVLPLLLGASVGAAGGVRPMFIAAGFVISFAAATLVFSAVTSILGFDQNSLRMLAVVLMIVFGALMLWPRPFEWLAAQVGSRFGQGGQTLVPSYAGNTGGFVLGSTLGLVWTPCAGPVLGSILALIATSPDRTQAGFLLTAYAIGAAVPLLAIAYGGRLVTTRLRGVARISRRLQQGFGAAVIVFALATYFQYDTELTLWLTHFYPNGRIGL